MDWSWGPGTLEFWEVAYSLGIEGVYSNEGEHPSGSPIFYIHRKEALGELREALAGRYKIVVTQDQARYDTSDSADIDAAAWIIAQARAEPVP